jgi:hypothetical protein
MQLAANVTSGDVANWQSINWKRVYQTVKNLRQRILRASREGDLKRVRSLQRLMLRCQANVLKSVRRVTPLGGVCHADDVGVFGGSGATAVLSAVPSGLGEMG